MRSITAGMPIDRPPEWAALERQALDLLSDVVEPTLATYYHDDELAWPVDGGGTDDAYECFSNLPLVYLLGGHERTLAAAIDHWEHVTERFARDGPGDAHTDIIDEYFGTHDWMHMGEGNQLFYHLCLAAPHREQIRARAIRFADLYVDPDHENWDPSSGLIRAPNSGSDGPADRTNPEAETGADAWGYADWKDPYHLPFTDVEGVETVDDLRDPEAAARMGEAVADRWRDDTAVNLAATSLVANAYLLTGEDEYREWILSYVDRWVEATAENDGILPDNIGLEEGIGEHTGGKWYGNYYGWTWPHGWLILGDSLLTAVENAGLVAGDPERAATVARTTVDALLAAGIERNDVMHVPFKHGDDGTFEYEPLNPSRVLRAADGSVLWRDGWFEFKPMQAAHPVHLVHTTGASADRERADRLLAGRTGQPIRSGGKDAGDNEGPWYEFLSGSRPDYPVEILHHTIEHVAEKLELARERRSGYVPEDDEFLNRDSPFDVEGLVQCILGGPMPLYNGGLLRTRVRPFDLDRERPGLPDDVAALVAGMTDSSTTIELVNLGARDRTVALQAGTFGEHVFGDVHYDARSDGNRQRRTLPVDASAVEVTLPGASAARLECETRRFAGQPSYDPPWEH